MKTCSRCREAQPDANFCKNRRSSDGLNNRCRSCESARKKPYNEAQRVLAEAYYQDNRQKDETRRDFAISYFVKSQGVTGLSNLLATWVDFDPVSECYNWKGSLNNKGYGTYGVVLPTEPLSTIAVKAHRLVWALASGDLPQSNARQSGVDQVLDHKCRNRKCVNPLHLQVTTHSHNAGLSQEREAPTRFKDLVAL